MAQLKPEMNYYPITISSSTKEGTPEDPKSNTPNVSDTGLVKESAGSGKIVQNSFQSSNYVKGKAGWAIKADGFAEFDDLDVRDNAYIGDRDNTHIHLDGTNVRMRSSNYVPGIAGAGFTIEPDLIEVGHIRARGTIATASFQKDVVSAIGGNLLTSKGAETLNADMTALDNSDVVVEGNETFAVNDILRIKDGTDDEWLEVDVVGAGATDTGAVSPGTISEDTSVGTEAWNPGGDDITIGASTTAVSYYNKCTNFATFYTIPTTATIDGIEVTIRKSADHQTDGATDNEVRLVKADDTYTTENKAKAGAWATSPTIYTYGGSSDLWGETWTPADVNNSNFGFVISANLDNDTGSPFTATADIKQIKVYYTFAGGSYVVTRDKGGAYSADSNPAWKKGATIVNYGQSGDGLIFQTASETNAPYVEIQTHAGVPWTTIVKQLRIGNLNGIGGFSSDVYGIHIGDVSTGKYLQYDSSSGNLIVNDSNLLLQNLFGDGSDGDVTISGSTTLTRDMYYNDLTIESTGTLTTAGFRVFVKGTLQIDASGKIERNGNTGGNGTNATDWNVAGTGGSVGAALADGSMKGALAGEAGKNGVAGVELTANGTGNGNSNTGNSGTNIAKSLADSDGKTGSAGGNGGDATTSTGTGSKGTGTGGSAGTRTGTVFNQIKNAMAAYLLYDFFPAGDYLKAAPTNGGASAGGSGGVSIFGVAGDSARSGATGGSGGGGSNGGIIAIFAQKLVLNGTIEAKGGVGGNAGTTFASSTSCPHGTHDCAAGGSGGSSGGTGGNGGVIVLVYKVKSGSGSIDVSGGAAGTSASGVSGSTVANAGSPTADAGSNGTGVAGNDGVVIELVV